MSSSDDSSVWNRPFPKRQTIFFERGFGSREETVFVLYIVVQFWLVQWSSCKCARIVSEISPPEKWLLETMKVRMASVEMLSLANFCSDFRLAFYQLTGCRACWLIMKHGDLGSCSWRLIYREVLCIFQAKSAATWREADIPRNPQGTEEWHWCLAWSWQEEAASKCRPGWQ